MHSHNSFGSGHWPSRDIQALKQRLLIPEVWERLGLPGKPGTSCHSPFREDKSPSFSVYSGGQRWKDHSTGQGGDVIDLIALAQDVDNSEAARRFLAMAGASHPQTCPKLQPPAFKGPMLPSVKKPTEDEVRLIAASRRLDPGAVELAARLSLLVIGEVHGHRSWILTDSSEKIAEARRLDGKPFPPGGPLSERKAHTFKNSSKAWPVGTAVLTSKVHCRAVMMVEGGPDLLAALHFALDAGDVLPIAMLGRSAGAAIDPDAMGLLRDRRVRIYPHHDADGGGRASAKKWAAQLYAAGCRVDFFTFDGLTRHDGKPVKDLNDAVLIHPDQCSELSNLLP